MFGSTVSSIVFGNYAKWEKGQIVFINTPTGSGKTTFVLNDLLNYAYQNCKKILYLVNRTILRNQIMKRISFQYQNTIFIKTYQEIEEKKCGQESYNINDYDYVIADESHYFIEDALFNAKTNVSFELVLDYAYKKLGITVFMSATNEKFFEYFCLKLKSRESAESIEKSRLENSLEEQKQYRLSLSYILNYSLPMDYSYLDIKPLFNVSQILQLINSDKGKWLVFYNNSFHDYIMASLSENSTVVTAKTKKQKTVKVLEMDEKIPDDIDVVFTTSVIDNGINVNDQKLRNLIIIADSKEQLIQMIGRKRKDGEKVKVFLYVNTIDEVNKKKKPINDTLYLLREISSVSSGILDTCGNINSYELMKRILNDSKLIEIFKRLFYPTMRVMEKNGITELNAHLQFSETAIYALNKRMELFNYVYNILTHDPMAYYKLQLSWLGFDNTYIENNVSENSRTNIEIAKDEIIQLLDEVDGVWMTKEEFIALFNGSVKKIYENHIKPSITVPHDKTLEDTFRKNDRTISDKSLNCLLSYVGLEGKYKRETKKETADDGVIDMYRIVKI